MHHIIPYDERMRNLVQTRLIYIALKMKIIFLDFYI